MPGVPTVAEQNLPGYEGILWIGMMAPAGTPDAVIDRLAAATTRSVRSPELVERFRHDGIDPGRDGRDAFGVRISREIAQSF